MPEGMKFPLGQDLWMPLVPTANYEKRDASSLLVFGRLADRTTLASARADMDTIAVRLVHAYPKSNQGSRAPIQPYNYHFNSGHISFRRLGMLGSVRIAC